MKNGEKIKTENYEFYQNPKIIQFLPSIITVLDKNNYEISLYPKTDQSESSLILNRKELTHFEKSAENNSIIAYKISQDSRSLIQAWNISFIRQREKIIAFDKGTKLSEKNLYKTVTLSGQKFKPHSGMQDTLVVLTVSEISKAMTIYYISALHGVVYNVLPIYENLILKDYKPIFMIYENFVLIGLQAQMAGVKNKIILMEICSAKEISDPRNNKYNAKYNRDEHELSYTVRTVIELDFKIMGATIFSDIYKNIDYIAVLDNQGAIHLLNIEKFEKGQTQHSGEGEENLFEISKNVWLKYPTKIQISTLKSGVYATILSGDLYSFKL